MNAMATLRDRDVREQASSRRSRVSAGAELTPAEEHARSELADAFATFDGSDAAYVAHLTGVSQEDMRRVGAI